MTDSTLEQPNTPPPPTEPPTVTAPSEPKKRLSPLAAGLLGLSLGAGIVGATWAITANNGPDEPATFTLTGTFSLTEDAVTLDDTCHGTGGYDDIGTGTSVTVYGAKGDVVATGKLEGGNETGFGACEFAVSVPDVPKGEKFYKVEVSHRGTLQLTSEEAENGEFAGSLG
ncbi:hypothetical protein ACIP25_11585 [Streptomyces massasporeus]|uniref:hypothetical protein n=1 Tax=Streptomyces massasporeus TaxID=67324 RepID=UPI003803AA4F